MGSWFVLSIRSHYQVRDSFSLFDDSLREDICPALPVFLPLLWPSLRGVRDEFPHRSVDIQHVFTLTDMLMGIGTAGQGMKGRSFKRLF